MKIGILGARIIGSTLGRKWTTSGHEVMFGVRNPANPELADLVQSLGGQASAGGVAQAIEFGEVVVFAIPGAAMLETIRQHAALLDGKVVIDAANRQEGMLNSSADFAIHAPGAHYYRAFNSLGWENFENPVFDGIPADLFYCGPDGEGRAVTAQLIRDVGLNPVYLGGVEQASLVDSVARLWFALAFGQGMGRHLAFKVLRRD